MFLARALNTGRRRLPQRGLLQTLVLRTLLVCLVPLAIVAAVGLVLSRSLMESRFQQEAELVAATAEQDVSEQASNTTRAASLLAELPSTRQLMERQNPEALTSYLLPLKSRLGVDLMNVATTDGRLIAGAQDVRVGSTIPDSLIARGVVTADKAWEIFDEGTDVVLRAIAPVRATDGTQLGIIEVGVLLDAAFLTSARGNSNAELAIFWGGSAKAATIDTGNTPLPTIAEVDDSPDTSSCFGCCTRTAGASECWRS
jgi:sensor histidine kinase regulating citrate/malate metabolism